MSDENLSYTSKLTKEVTAAIILEILKDQFPDSQKISNLVNSSLFVDKLSDAVINQIFITFIEKKHYDALSAVLSSDVMYNRINKDTIEQIFLKSANLDNNLISQLMSVPAMRHQFESFVRESAYKKLYDSLKKTNKFLIDMVEKEVADNSALNARIEKIANDYIAPSLATLLKHLKHPNNDFVKFLKDIPALKTKIAQLKLDIAALPAPEVLELFSKLNDEAVELFLNNSKAEDDVQIKAKILDAMHQNIWGGPSFSETKIAEFFSDLSENGAKILSGLGAIQSPFIEYLKNSEDINEVALSLTKMGKTTLMGIFLSNEDFIISISEPGRLINEAARSNNVELLKKFSKISHFSGIDFEEDSNEFDSYQGYFVEALHAASTLKADEILSVLKSNFPFKYFNQEAAQDLYANGYQCEVMNDSAMSKLIGSLGAAKIPMPDCTSDRTFENHKLATSKQNIESSKINVSERVHGKSLSELLGNKNDSLANAVNTVQLEEERAGRLEAERKAEEFKQESERKLEESRLEAEQKAEEVRILGEKKAAEIQAQANAKIESVMQTAEANALAKVKGASFLDFVPAMVGFGLFAYELKKMHDLSSMSQLDYCKSHLGCAINHRPGARFDEHNAPKQYEVQVQLLKAVIPLVGTLVSTGLAYTQVLGTNFVCKVMESAPVAISSVATIFAASHIVQPNNLVANNFDNDWQLAVGAAVLEVGASVGAYFNNAKAVYSDATASNAPASAAPVSNYASNDNFANVLVDENPTQGE